MGIAFHFRKAGSFWELRCPRESAGPPCHFDLNPESEPIPIVSALPPNQQRYQWSIPASPCADCFLPVTQDNSGADYSGILNVVIVDEGTVAPSSGGTGSGAPDGTGGAAQSGGNSGTGGGDEPFPSTGGSQATDTTGETSSGCTTSRGHTSTGILGILMGLAAVAGSGREHWALATGRNAFHFFL